MSNCRPSQWFWGLIPLALVAAVILLGLKEHIEKDLEKRSALALQEATIWWAVPTFDARDGVLHGTAETTAERAKALGVVRGVWGVRVVHDKAKLLATVSPYTWWVSREETVVKLKGHVPSRDDRRTILGIVKANMAELEIDDRMKLAGGVPERPLWLGAVSFALNQLARLKAGSKARLDDMSISLSGEARSAADYQELKLALRTRLPTGLQLKQDGVTPPVARPFAWRAEYRDRVLTLSGHVPGDDTRRTVVSKARELFEGKNVSDRMEIGAGAPESWRQAVMIVLGQLKRLEWGVVMLSDTALTIEGEAKDPETANDVATKVRQGLPAIYKSEENVTSGSAPPEKTKTESQRKTDRSLAQPPSVNGGGRGDVRRRFSLMLRGDTRRTAAVWSVSPAVVR